MTRLYTKHAEVRRGPMMPSKIKLSAESPHRRLRSSSNPDAKEGTRMRRGMMQMKNPYTVMQSLL